MSDIEKEAKENPFINFKFLEDVKETSEYKNAKERIELIEDIFSINEETYSQVIKRLKEYLRENENMVQMFILVISIFVSTKFKAAKQFGKILFDFFMNNYKEKTMSLYNVHDSLFNFNKKILNEIDFKNIVKESFISNDFQFYKFKEGSIPHILLNDDIEGLQDYVEQQKVIDFHIKAPNLVVETVLLDQEPTYFDYSILFSAIKCFKYILLNDEVEISDHHNFYAIASGNIEIIHILEQTNNHYDRNCFSASIIFHHNEIFQWLIRNYLSDLECLSDFIPRSIFCYNEEIFYFILNNCGTFNNFPNLTTTLLAIFTMNIPIANYLYEEYHLSEKIFKCKMDCFIFI